MAQHEGIAGSPRHARRLFAQGSRWTDEHLFNGRYYIQQIQPPADASDVCPGLSSGWGRKISATPTTSWGRRAWSTSWSGSTWRMSADLGYLVMPEHVRTTLASIMKYNYQSHLADHFNCHADLCAR